jgi:hypothetical protein
LGLLRTFAFFCSVLSLSLSLWNNLYRHSIQDGLSLVSKAFERFCNDRRVPTHVRLNNGTNFVAGKKDLSDMWQYISESYVKSHKPNIKLDFTPPNSPSQNGLIERMVRSAKAALRTVLDVTNKVITHETLLTCFKKVQGLLNDRPLAYSSKDCNDLEFLTPNHFILSGKIGEDLAPIINYRKKRLETKKQNLNLSQN